MQKRGENPNTTALDITTEGDDNNSNNKPSVSPATLPYWDFSKIVVNKTMATA